MSQRPFFTKLFYPKFYKQDGISIPPSLRLYPKPAVAPMVPQPLDTLHSSDTQINSGQKPQEKHNTPRPPQRNKGKGLQPGLQPPADACSSLKGTSWPRTGRAHSLSSWACAEDLYANIFFMKAWRESEKVSDSCCAIPSHDYFWNSCGQLAKDFFLCRSILNLQGRRGKWLWNMVWGCTILIVTCTAWSPLFLMPLCQSMPGVTTSPWTSLPAL